MKFAESKLFCLQQEVFIYFPFSHSSELLFFASHQNVLIEKYFFFRTGMFSTQHVVSMEGGYGAMTRCSYSWPLPVLRTSFLFLHRGGDLLGDKWQKQLFSSQFLKTEHERRLLLL